jgi:hypothetical protein
MLLTGLVQKAKFVVIDNADTILTGMGVTGTVATAYLTGRASFKAAQLIDHAEREIAQDNEIPLNDQEKAAGMHLTPELTKWTKLKLTWRLYVPAVGVGTTTVTSIVIANRLSAKKIAALAVASGISERALQEYKAKVIEKLSDKQDQTIRDEIAQDRVNKYPPNSREIILAGTGDVLCYDMLTGRYFQSTVEDIKRAENKMNYQLLHHMSASLSEFYDEVGLPPTSYTDSVGWNQTERFEVRFSTVLSPDNRPCLAIDFAHPPQLEYSRRYYD